MMKSPKSPRHAPLWAGWRLRVFSLLGLLGLLGLMLAGPDSKAQVTPPQTSRAIVYIVPIDGTVDLGQAPMVARVLAEAEQAGAAAVILDINTFGGRVDGAVLIRDALLLAKVPTVAFVNKRAISAGALIALATEKIAIADGATIGAATPVTIGGPGGAAMPVAEKTVSYMRKEFAATAEARKRPTLLAEAMVDADVEIKDVIDKGKLLTLTTEEAMQHKLADFRANSLDAVLKHLGLADAELRKVQPNWAEALVRFLTDPVVSSILMTIGIIGVITEIRTPGFGVPGAIGLTSLGLFYWAHALVQLAGFEEMLLLGAGLVLLVVEVFVIPGFGLVGGLGLVALLAGLALSLVGAGATWGVVVDAVWQVVISMVVAIVALVFLLRFITKLRLGRSLVLDDEMPADKGYASAPEADKGWLGRRGVAASTLRPAGLADLGDQRVDVVSDGDYIEAGEAVVVTRVDGNRIVVRRPHAETKQFQQE